MLAGETAAVEGNVAASGVGTAVELSSAVAVDAECVQEHPGIYNIKIKRLMMAASYSFLSNVGYRDIKH